MKINQKALTPTFELYLHPQQRNGGQITGFKLEKYLEKTGLVNRAFSLEDELVKSWFADPATYPEEFKSKSIFLWKSKLTSGGYRFVACLLWIGGRVVLHWRELKLGRCGFALFTCPNG